MTRTIIYFNVYIISDFLTTYISVIRSFIFFSIEYEYNITLKVMKIPTQKEGHSYKVVPITKRGNRSKDVYPHDNSSDKEVGKLTRIALAHTLDR